MKTFSFFSGFLLALVGLVSLGVNLDWINPSIWITLGQFWPVLIILLGVFLIIRSALVILVIAIVATLTLGILIDRGVMDQKLVSVPWLTDQIEVTSTYEKSVPTATASTIDLELSDSTEVVITATDSNEVVVMLEGPKSQVERYYLETQGNSIRLIRRTPGNWTFDWWNDRITGTITIPRSAVLQLNISGVSDVTLESFSGPLSVEISGASQLETTSPQLVDPYLNVSGASKAFIAQASGEIKAVVSGASQLTFKKVEADGIDAMVSGASKMRVESGEVRVLTGSVSGASHLTLPTPGDNYATTSGGGKIKTTY